MRTLQALAAQLLAGLQEAERRRLADQEDAGRAGAIWALTEVIIFIREASRRLSSTEEQLSLHSCATGLDMLASALIELHHGVVPAIVKPAEIHNRSITPRHIRLLRARAAAAAEILLLTDRGVETACKLVAKHIAAREELSGIAQERAWKSVRHWRSTLLKTEPRPSIDDLAANPNADAGVAHFDFWLGLRDQALSQGKSTRELAFAILDLGVGVTLKKRAV